MSNDEIGFLLESLHELMPRPPTHEKMQFFKVPFIVFFNIFSIARSRNWKINITNELGIYENDKKSLHQKWRKKDWKSLECSNAKFIRGFFFPLALKNRISFHSARRYLSKDSTDSAETHLCFSSLSLSRVHFSSLDERCELLLSLCWDERIFQAPRLIRDDVLSCKNRRWEKEGRETYCKLSRWTKLQKESKVFGGQNSNAFLSLFYFSFYTLSLVLACFLSHHCPSIPCASDMARTCYKLNLIAVQDDLENSTLDSPEIPILSIHYYFP